MKKIYNSPKAEKVNFDYTETITASGDPPTIPSNTCPYACGTGGQPGGGGHTGGQPGGGGHTGGQPGGGWFPKPSYVWIFC